jgi:hypothetical protein
MRTLDWKATLGIWGCLTLFGNMAKCQDLFPYGLVFFSNLYSEKPVYYLEEGTLATKFYAQVLGGPPGGTLTPIALVGEQQPHVATNYAPGFFDDAVAFVPGVAPRESAEFVVRVWTGATNYAAAPFKGQSARWTQVTGYDTFGGPPPVIARLQIPAPVILTPVPPEEQAQAMATVSNGVVTVITLTHGGSEYVVPPTVAILGGGGIGAVATATITNGAVFQVAVQNPGNNYNSAPTIVIAPPFDFGTGLLAWWRGEGNADDDLGLHPGQWHGTEHYVDGVVGECLDVSGGYVTITNSEVFSFNHGSNDFTIETWVRPGFKPNMHNAGVVTKSAGTGGWALYFGTNGLCFANVGYWELCASLAGTATGSFHHVAITKGGDLYTLFYDGQAVGSLATNSLVVSDADVNLGIMAGDNSLLGYIDETAIYGRALSEREIKAICDLKVSGKYIEPIVVSPPEDTVGYLGGSNVLAVSVRGTGALQYQWLKDGVSVAGATNATLNLNGIGPNDAGSYAVQVYNSYGVAVSQPATLTVKAAKLSLGLTPKLTIEGVPGKTYGIQYTTNLADPVQWLTVTNITLTQPFQVWYDYATDATAPDQPRRYYQVIVAP